MPTRTLADKLILLMGVVLASVHAVCTGALIVGAWHCGAVFSHGVHITWVGVSPVAFHA